MCHLLEVTHAFFNHEEASKIKCVNLFSLFFFVVFYSNRELLSLEQLSHLYSINRVVVS